jgi:hypothetical protein
MNFTSHDISVIEKALRFAVNEETNTLKQNEYREVLSKLQNISMEAMKRASIATDDMQVDGFRLDYDDSSYLY